MRAAVVLFALLILLGCDDRAARERAEADRKTVAWVWIGSAAFAYACRSDVPVKIHDGCATWSWQGNEQTSCVVLRVQGKVAP